MFAVYSKTSYAGVAESVMFAGSLCALVTPMLADGRVDYESLENLIDWHVREGTDGIVAVGTTGESATLGFEKHMEVIEWVVKSVNGRLPVIAGSGANATDEAIRLTQSAKESGAEACLLVTPYYNKPTQEGMYRHFAAVAKAVHIPQILYNVPGRTAVDMLPETVHRLADIPNIIGIKEAKGTVERIRELVELCGDRMSIYTGDDGTAMESILAGAKGDISVTANVAPRLMHDMCLAGLEGDRERAESLDAKLRPLHRALFLEPNPIPVKWALHQMGLIPPGIRLPMTPLDSRFHDDVRGALLAAGVMA